MHPGSAAADILCSGHENVAQCNLNSVGFSCVRHRIHTTVLEKLIAIGGWFHTREVVTTQNLVKTNYTDHSVLRSLCWAAACSEALLHLNHQSLK